MTYKFDKTQDDFNAWLSSLPSDHIFGISTTYCVMAQFARTFMPVVTCGSTIISLDIKVAPNEQKIYLPDWAMLKVKLFDEAFHGIGPDYISADEVRRVLLSKPHV